MIKASPDRDRGRPQHNLHAHIRFVTFRFPTINLEMVEPGKNSLQQLEVLGVVQSAFTLFRNLAPIFALSDGDLSRTIGLDRSFRAVRPCGVNWRISEPEFEGQ